MREERRRAQRLIAEVAGADDDIVALAEVVSLALTVDPALLRAARRRFVVWRGPDLEADLWHSPLVASSNATGFVLVADVATELRMRLAGRVPATGKHTSFWSRSTPGSPTRCASKRSCATRPWPRGRRADPAAAGQPGREAQPAGRRGLGALA